MAVEASKSANDLPWAQLTNGQLLVDFSSDAAEIDKTFDCESIFFFFRMLINHALNIFLHFVC